VGVEERPQRGQRRAFRTGRVGHVDADRLQPVAAAGFYLARAASLA
jgi:hypothetical protein